MDAIRSEDVRPARGAKTLTAGVANQQPATPQPRATRVLPKRGILEANKDDIFASLAKLEPWAVIIERYAVAKPSFRAFVKRHRAEIDALKARTSELVQDVARRDKAVRIRGYDGMINRIEALIEERGGLEAVDYKGLGQGENYKIREVRRFDAPMVQQWLNLHRQIADELGDIPRAPAFEFTDRRTYILQMVTSGNNDTPLG